MNRRLFLSTSTLAAVASLAEARNTRDSSSLKKGWSGGTAKTHQLVGANWHYNWGLKGQGENFVPMFKGKKQIQGRGLNQLKSIPKLPYLLGYNEPEREKQGNLSLEEALDFWPRLQEVAETKGTLLGSPAPSSDQAGLDWLEEFMSQAKRRKLKVDFIAVHYYGGCDADRLEGLVNDLSRSHRLPIWLTEFNGWSGTREEHEEFLKDALRFLEKERSIERYAYFEPGKGKPHSLFQKDGTLTKMGEMYRDAGS